MGRVARSRPRRREAVAHRDELPRPPGADARRGHLGRELLSPLRRRPLGGAHGARDRAAVEAVRRAPLALPARRERAGGRRTPLAPPGHERRRRGDDLQRRRHLVAAAAVMVVGEEAARVHARREVGRVRREGDVDHRGAGVRLGDDAPGTALALVVLTVGGDIGGAVGVEPDLDELPVALVDAEAEHVLRVVVREQPVLQPGLAARGHRAPVGAIAVARGAHALRVLLVGPVRRVEEVRRRRRACVGVGRIAEEGQREVRQRVRGVGGGQPHAAAADEVVLAHAGHEVVGHLRRRVREVGLLGLVAQLRREAAQEVVE